MSPELDDLYLPVEAGLDEVLQHLVLRALTVNMEQQVQEKTFSFSISCLKTVSQN